VKMTSLLAWLPPSLVTDQDPCGQPSALSTRAHWQATESVLPPLSSDVVFRIPRFKH
jgi:hypothetical protein